jgi:glycosyltransferase involved in cell wall biosynthesis
MRLVFVCEHYFPEIGGLERSTHRLAIAMQEKGHNVVVLAPEMPDFNGVGSIDGILVVRSPYNETHTFSASELSRQYLSDADAICVFGISDDKNARIWHSVFEYAATPKFLKIGTEGDIKHKGVQETLLRRFNGIFCQNDAIAEECQALGIATENCLRIQNGLDIEEWNRQINLYKEGSKLSTHFTACAIGRFVVRKRFPIVIEAFRKFAKHNKDATLLLHGSDFGQSDGEETIIRDLTNRAVREGYNISIISPLVPTSSTLAVCGTSVSIGQREGAPNIILESLAGGVPVIASDISGHSLYVDHKVHGFLCPNEGERLEKALISGFVWANANYNNKMVKLACANKASQFDIRETSAVYERHIKKYIR